MKQYHDNGNIWQYTIEDDFKCDCGCNVFHKEYNKVRNKIWYVCNACDLVVAELKDEYLNRDLQSGIWK